MQFPPSMQSASLPQLIQLVNAIREADPEQSWKVVLEFRHSSWYNEPLREFAVNNNLAIVLQDIPKSATPLDLAQGDTVYLRFHGPDGKYRGSYPDDVLQEYSTYIYEWQGEGKTVYAYFNNTMGDAVNNLATLNGMIDQLS